jgi:hypothetical protein
MYRAPKSVLKHPGVASCTSGFATGADQPHYVELKEGWWFRPPYEISSLFFTHVRDPRGGFANREGRVWTDYAHLIERKPGGAT